MLRLSKLRKSFGALVAVDDLSLDVKRGEVFGLLGPNGAGKSTTISMCVGLIGPDSGTVELEGFGSPSDPQVRRNLGLAPQSLAVYDELSGEENLRFFAQLYAMHGARLKERVGRVLELVGLTSKRNDKVRTYSGGMKRRLNLGVAVLHEPPLLLLDEPTAGVDPQSRNNILELVRELARGGTTVVYTTHYMEEASKLCDRVAIMDKGRLLALGTVLELIASHGSMAVVTVTRASGEERVETDIPAVEAARLLSSGDVQNLRVDRPDLETVFLSLTGRSLRD
jgi:ABC-2 type transport system ATP-binding protein